MTTLRRSLPLLVLVAVLVGAYALGLHRWLSWAVLGERQAALQALVAAQPVASAAGYVLLYALAVAASFPAAALLTVAGGLLFGTVLGTALAVSGATLGAVGFFLAARSALRPMLERQAGPALTRRMAGVQARMERDGFSYMLALRLLPVMPFWLINIAAALAGVRLWAFALATMLGIAPAGAVYASLGAGVGAVLAVGGRPDLSVVFSPPVLLPLVALAVLALLPLGWRWAKGRMPG